MKKTILSLAMLILAGGAMAQTDKAAAKAAAKALKEAKVVCDEISSSKNSSMDIIAMLIKNVWNALGKITGESENEDIIDLIFSKFCLGK